MIYSILFLILAALSYWFWRTKYVPAQVARNLAAFDADGANDTLQRGFHSREVWRRVWPGLACCAVPALPVVFAGWLPATMAFLSMAALLAGVFARDFTPLLNEARTATRPDITTWYASPASKSWPDATAWVRIRRQYPPAPDQQVAANLEMQRIIRRTYYLCLAASLLLAGAAVAVALW